MRTFPITLSPELLGMYAGVVRHEPGQWCMVAFTMEDVRVSQEEARERGEEWRFWTSAEEFEQRRPTLYPLRTSLDTNHIAP